MLSDQAQGADHPMYKQFFNLKERPFKLVPNPSYLFLSRCHEEAIAHLAYTVSQGEGFVEITGEVGTGKTTLCRVFLESLDDTVEAAYIFNPKLDSLQLLKAVNDEFGISSDAQTVKELIDTLNRFLMQKKTEDKRIILLIDEAQNLSEEVLEQIRLLSNLETTRSKLLQIILVGQPELGEKLDSPNLRQLAQRITLRYHLSPLTYKETCRYIQHRLNVAVQNQAIRFSRPACKKIFKYSAGIPRLINIACDRTLLAAYVQNQRRITQRTAQAAVSELTSGGQRRTAGAGRVWKLVVGACLIGGLIGMLLPYRSQLTTRFRNLSQTAVSGEPADPSSSAGTLSEATVCPESLQLPMAARTDSVNSMMDHSESIPLPVKNVSPPPPNPNSQTPEASVSETLSTAEMPSPGPMDTTIGKNSRADAADALIRLWDTDTIPMKHSSQIPLGDNAYFCFFAKQYGLACHRIENDFRLIEQLNLPCILDVKITGMENTGYICLVQANETRFKIKYGHEKGFFWVDRNRLEALWAGTAFVYWKNFSGFTGIIPGRCPKESIPALKLLLKGIGFEHIELTSRYDAATQSAIEFIQQRHGLRIDGIVGPLTKIVIYNEHPTLPIPRLRVQRAETNEIFLE